MMVAEMRALPPPRRTGLLLPGVGVFGAQLALVLLFTLGGLLTHISLAPSAGAGEKAILRLCTWSGYFSDSALASFEATYDCLVAIDVFDSNEAMLTALEEGGDFDIVTPSSYMAFAMWELGLLQTIDQAQIPNLAHIDPNHFKLTMDPGARFSVPYIRSVAGIGYNRSMLGDLEESWSLFDRDDLAGRMTMFDDMREAMGAALKRLGYSLNSTDAAELAEAGELLLEWRRHLAKFEVDEGNIGLGSGRYAAVQGYNGDLLVLMEENKNIGFFVPAEGSSITSDDFVILGKSKNSRLAHFFINHLLTPAVAADNMEGIMYYMPIPDALELLPEKMLKNPAFALPEKTLLKCESIRELGQDTIRYEEIWNVVRGGGD